MFFKVLFTLLFSIIFITSCGGNKKTTKMKVVIEKDDDITNESLTNSLNHEDFKFITKKAVEQLKNSDLIKKAMEKKGSKLAIEIGHFSNKTSSHSISSNIQTLKNDLERNLITTDIFLVINTRLLKDDGMMEHAGGNIDTDFEFKATIFEDKVDNSYSFSYKLIDLKTKKIFFKNKVLVKKKKVRVMHRTF